MASSISISMIDKIVKINLIKSVLTKSTVISIFLLPLDAVYALYYYVNGETTYCSMNEAGTKFILPDGWKNITFFVKSDKVPSRPATPFDIKEKSSSISTEKVKLLDEDKIIAKDIEWFNSIRQFALYYTDNDSVKRCVTPISPGIAATYAHESLTVDSTKERPILVRSYFDKTYCVPAKVVTKDDNMDVVILQAVSMKFVNECLNIESPEVGMRYLMLGLSNIEHKMNNLSVGYGSVMAKFDDELRFIGSSGSTNGDSGGGVWNSNGSLIGMNILVRRSLVQVNERTQRQYAHVIGGTFVFLAVSYVKLLASGYIPRPPPISIEE